MHKAICVKSGGSITNLGSGEGQDEHGEVIRYCTSTRPTKAFSGHRAAVRHRDSGEGNKKKKEKKKSCIFFVVRHLWLRRHCPQIY